MVTTKPPEGKRWHTREDSGIRLDADGNWWHDDERIEHAKIIEAFNVGLSVAEDGRYRLDFGNDWCFVQVEDAAYRVVTATVDISDGTVWLDLTDRSREALAPSTLSLDARGIFLVKVKDGRAVARFTREAQAALGEYLEERDGRAWLVVGDTRVPLDGLSAHPG